MASYIAADSSPLLSAGTSSNSNRTGGALDTQAWVPNSGGDTGYEGQNLSPSQSIGQMVADGVLNGAPSVTRSRTAKFQDGTAAVSNASVFVTEYEGQGLTSEQTVGGMKADGSLSAGSLIPTAYFRRVTGNVVDVQGDPITNAQYVISLDNFGIVGNVNDQGEYNIYLLKQSYSDFVLIADDGKLDGFDLAYYESVDNGTLEIGMEEKDLVFDTSKTIKPGSGGLRIKTSIGLG